MKSCIFLLYCIGVELLTFSAVVGVKDGRSSARKPGDDKYGLDTEPTRQGKRTTLGAGRRASAAGRRTAPGSATKKAQTSAPMSKYSSDQTDKIFELQRENTALKSKENLLETEIIKMRTKLRRIEELMKKRSTTGGAQPMLPAEVQRQLEDEIKRMSGENDQMKERNKKLQAIEKELNLQYVTQKAPTNKFAHVRGKLNNGGSKKSEQAFHDLVDELKAQLHMVKKRTARLKTQRAERQRDAPAATSSDLQKELDAQQQELIDITKRIADIKSDRIRDQAAFEQSKAYVEEK